MEAEQKKQLAREFWESIKNKPFYANQFKRGGIAERINIIKPHVDCITELESDNK